MSISTDSDYRTCIDRDEETREILDAILKNERSSIHIIYSATAVGKTTLSTKVLHSVDSEKMIPLHIMTSPENGRGHIQEWVILDRLFKKINEISKYSKNGLLTFEDYIGEDSIIQSGALEGLYNSFGINRYGFFKYWLSKQLRLNEYNPNSILLDDSLRSQMVKKAYLSYAFHLQRFFVVIDNLQNIDSSSLESLLEILNDSSENKHFILLEYTLSPQLQKEELERLVDFIRNSAQKINVTCSLLRPLPRGYVVDVVNHAKVNKPSSFEFNIDLLKYYDNYAKGNLKQIVEFTANYEKEHQICKENVCTDETLQSILSIRNDKALYVLSILIHYRGILPVNTLNEINLYFEDNCDWTPIFNELSDARLIKEDTSEEIRLDHASISDSWHNSDNSRLDSIDTVVCQVLESYYTRLINSGTKESNNLPWLALLELYRDKYPEKIPRLIHQLREGLLKNVSPSTAWGFFSAFLDATKKAPLAYIQTYYDVILACFEFELYDEGYHFVEVLEPFVDYGVEYKLLFHKMLYLSALDRHEENVELFRLYEHTFNDGTREKLNLLIISQASFRALNNINQCRVIHDNIMKNRKYYGKYLEFGYFLRIANMYIPKQKAVRYLRKSYHFFLKRGQLRQAGKSAISYAHIVSSLGYLHLGERLISKAEELLQDTTMGSHMFWLNKAVIQLHEGKHDRSIWNNLDLAEKSACVSFDKLAIKIAKLIWKIQNDEYNKIDSVISEIKRLAQAEPDKHIVAIAYYDLYYYYSLIGQKEEARIYRNLAYKFRKWAPSIEARLEHKANWENRFLLKKPWGIAFLEYWTYDLLY